jgi:hypothetical protein
MPETRTILSEIAITILRLRAENVSANPRPIAASAGPSVVPPNEGGGYCLFNGLHARSRSTPSRRFRDECQNAQAGRRR